MLHVITVSFYYQCLCKRVAYMNKFKKQFSEFGIFVRLNIVVNSNNGKNAVTPGNTIQK